MTIVITSCGSRQNENLQYLKSQETENEGIPLGYLGLKINKELRRGFKQGADPEEFSEIGCDSWELPLSSMRNILRDMRRVEGEEWYALCYNYPCWYKGRASNGKLEYDFYVNAASYIILSNEDETLHFILEKPSEIFLTACDCCE